MSKKLSHTNTNLKIPIIILNWNGIDDTKNCIRTLSSQTYKDFIIYLVDNGSEKNNVNEIKKQLLQ